MKFNLQEYTHDVKEDIDRCLSCVKDECNNCMEHNRTACSTSRSRNHRGGRKAQFFVFEGERVTVPQMAKREDVLVETLRANVKKYGMENAVYYLRRKKCSK